MPNRNYKRGYTLERHCMLTLESMGMHCKRNTLSIGVEDVIAFDALQVWLIQCKNTKRKDKGMSKDEQEILRRHAKELGAVPVYLFKDGRGKYVWQDLNTGFPIEHIQSFTKEWYRERMKEREKLRAMKKKNPQDYNKYVLANWSKVSNYIC